MRVKTPIDYDDDGQALEGWLVYDEDFSRPGPGILVFPEFMGLGAYLDRHVERFADLGYTVLAADLFGKGIRPVDARAALAYSRPLRDNRPAMRRRARAAWDCLRRLDRVEPDRTAAVGYSFGGCAALELARSGADLRGAVSFYGYLDTPVPAPMGTIKAKLLVSHGIHDPVVPMASLAAYCDEMAAAGADSRVVTYTDAGHGFCNQRMDGSQHPWNRYSRGHDERSWRTLVEFLKRVLGDQPPVERR